MYEGSGLSEKNNLRPLSLRDSRKVVQELAWAACQSTKLSSLLSLSYRHKHKQIWGNLKYSEQIKQSSITVPIGLTGKRNWESVFKIKQLPYKNCLLGVQETPLWVNDSAVYWRTKMKGRKSRDTLLKKHFLYITICKTGNTAPFLKAPHTFF